MLTLFVFAWAATGAASASAPALLTTATTALRSGHATPLGNGPGPHGPER